MIMDIQKLKDWVSRQEDLWTDFDTIKKELLNGETIADWLLEELETLARMIKEL